MQRFNKSSRKDVFSLYMYMKYQNQHDPLGWKSRGGNRAAAVMCSGERMSQFECNITSWNLDLVGGASAMADTAAMSPMRVMNEATGRIRSHAMKNQVSENFWEIDVTLSKLKAKKSVQKCRSKALQTGSLQFRLSPRMSGIMCKASIARLWRCPCCEPRRKGTERRMRIPDLIKS